MPIKFSCETIPSRVFVCQKLFDYYFNFISYYWSVQAFCFFFIEFWEVIFLEICPFHLGFHISWHIVLHSNFLQSFVFLLFSPVSFLVVFIWVLSLFFLMSLLKSFSILFIFSKNQLLDSLIFRIVL